ncbi:hypothetical protein LEP1GSC111_2921 [Leptospira interrogans str. UT126]|nr:hypothetical protein LEP1GSC111_2921 [Leptospira interrogans str. UT126]
MNHSTDQIFSFYKLFSVFIFLQNLKNNRTSLYFIKKRF